ncbi:hypothetical protein SAMN05444397_107168 [Flavobacterium aquidurense]|nr:hypothetical protein SAMN05444397_107168 [Flavobacterium aquidurense]
MKWIYADKLTLRFEKYATDLHRLKKSLKSFIPIAIGSGKKNTAPISQTF